MKIIVVQKYCKALNLSFYYTYFNIKINMMLVSSPSVDYGRSFISQQSLI